MKLGIQYLVTYKEEEILLLMTEYFLQDMELQL